MALIPARNVIANAKDRAAAGYGAKKARQRVAALAYRFRQRLVTPESMTPDEREAVQEYLFAHPATPWQRDPLKKRREH